MHNFQVLDRIQMKDNLSKIDTYGFSPSLIKKHKNTVFVIRKVYEDTTGQYALRVYPNCYVKNSYTGTYEQQECIFYLAWLNPEMFEKVEGEFKNEKKSLFRKIFSYTR